MAIFLHFYVDLYTSKIQYTPAELLGYLQQESLPSLILDDRIYVNGPIQAELEHWVTLLNIRHQVWMGCLWSAI